MLGGLPSLYLKHPTAWANPAETPATGLQLGRHPGKCQIEHEMRVSMSIDQNTASKVAKLARIKVEDEALPGLAAEFNTILDFIEQLNEVDVEGVDPMTSVTPQRLKRRDDVVTDGNQADKVLSNAPDAREGFFAVPKVME
ncbi:glutamyl-tRNA(Gln) amidotransferase, C subunit [Roseobacter sp. MED193]|nr:glutamyl-tRNA(Gln) amidotransferase, C subunit [Roseobacter sp. MED193]